MNNQHYYLITRPHDRGNDLKKIMLEKQIPVINEAIIDIKPLKINSQITDSDILIFTSGNAIYSFAQQSQARNNLIYTLNGNSYSIAQNLGFNNIIKAGNNAEQLLKSITNKQKRFKGVKLIHLSGDKITCDISQELAKIYLKSERVICYETEYKKSFSTHLQQIIKEQKLAAVIFFSANTAIIFTELLKKTIDNYQNITALTISNKIAIALRDLKWNNILISEEISNNSICDLALKDYESKYKALN